LTFAGVVLPAVFFNDELRRRDARAVLQQLLDALRPAATALGKAEPPRLPPEPIDHFD
jgi:hypothetical protein